MDYHKAKNILLMGVIAIMVSIGVVFYVYIKSTKTIQ